MTMLLHSLLRPGHLQATKVQKALAIASSRSYVSSPRWTRQALTMASSRSYISSSHRWTRLSGPTLKNSFQMNPTIFRSNIVLGQYKYPMPLAVHLGSLAHFSSARKPPNNLARNLGVIGTGAVVLMGKGKYLLGALKLTKFASLGSLLLSVGTYTMFFGFPYAVGMMSLITVHEAGHALVMLQRGIPFSPMVFVPFVGAAVAMKKLPRNAWEEALVAFGGPILGGLGAGAVAVGAQVTQSQLLFALADFGFMINLFNCLPIGMMDGGRICAALSPYAGVAGLGLGGMLAYSGAVHNPIFYLILLAGGYETFQRFYNPTHVPPNYYRITAGQRMMLTGGYFGLVAALIGGMALNQKGQKPPEVLIREAEAEKHWDARY